MESQLVHAGVQKRAWMQRRQALDLEVHSSKKLEVSFWLDDADRCSCERCGLRGPRAAVEATPCDDVVAQP